MRERERKLTIGIWWEWFPKGWLTGVIRYFLNTTYFKFFHSDSILLERRCIPLIPGTYFKMCHVQKCWSALIDNLENTTIASRNLTFSDVKTLPSGIKGELALANLDQGGPNFRALRSFTNSVNFSRCSLPFHRSHGIPAEISSST